jgi:hypothetical protein
MTAEEHVATAETHLRYAEGHLQPTEEHLADAEVHLKLVKAHLAALVAMEPLETEPLGAATLFQISQIFVIYFGGFSRPNPSPPLQSIQFCAFFH